MEASSLGSSKPPWKYHVFLSFRGSDTRKGFTDHLYNAIWRKGIIAFRDNNELEKGKDIKKQLPQAIDESLVAIVILSRNYASSSWCLNELQKILESKDDPRRTVLPVFYEIDPACIRHQTGSFAKAFEKHERYEKNKEKVQRWRDALSEIADLSGWNSKHRLETELIGEITTQLWRMLKAHLPLYTDVGLVGIDRRIEDLYQKLEIGSTGIRFVGISGMGGLGKTTLVILLFNQIRSHFDISCCLENVREKSNSAGGLLDLQKQLLSHLKIGDLKIDNLNYGKAMIRNLLCHKRVLLVLDDVNNIKQLENLAGMLDWFGKGSRVIVTTRDVHLLACHEVQFEDYKLKVLTTDESVELFCLKAFKRKHPNKDYLKLSQNVVEFADGLPLALEVLGLHLCGRPKDVWAQAIDKFRKDPPKSILDNLMISYEGLEDSEKTIFLDIACFFKGWPKDRVIQILKNCGFDPDFEIEILMERSLLTCKNQVFWMHDLLEEMGKRIVIQKSDNEISKQSRLWSVSDIDEVLEENQGTKFIEALVLKADKDEANWHPEAFCEMRKLRMLIILHGFPLSLDLRCLPVSIKVLEWNGYPLKYLPDGVKLRKLVELKMWNSKITQPWSGTRDFQGLRFIDFSFSKDLIQTPNFIGVPNLESLILEGCSNLVEIHQSVGQLKKLLVLSLKDCLNLKQLPTHLETNSLKDFILYGCSALEKLPEFGENMEGITMLDLRGCNNLICLPNSICNLKSLKILNISKCSALEKLPEFGEHMALEILDLSGCRRLGSNSWCKSRPLRPMALTMSSVSGLSLLRKLDVSFCDLSDGSIPYDLSHLSSLEKINLSGNDFANLPPGCISNLSRLRYLDLSFCPKLQSLPLFPPSLRKVSAINCGPMEALPDEEIWKLFKFEEREIQRHISSPREDDRDYVMYISGREIPTWFNNLMSIDKGWALNWSIDIDIPDCCRSSTYDKWWGIVVCFLFEPPSSVEAVDMEAPRNHFFCDLGCFFTSPKPDLAFYDHRYDHLHWLRNTGMGLNSCHQLIKVFHGYDSDIKRVVRRGHKKVRMFTFYDPGRIGYKLSKCAWRVTYEDMPSYSNLEKARITEMEE